MSERDAVSIIIVTYNSLPALADCLKSIPAACGNLPWQLIVVDNASADGSLETVKRDCPAAITISNEGNRGFAAACNQGANLASNHWLLFLNPDVQLDPKSVVTLIMAMKQFHKVGLATMRLRNPDDTFQANCRNFPTIINLLFSRGSILGRLVLNRINPNSLVYTLPDYSTMTEVPAVSATAMGVRRELFKWVHGFDQRYHMYMEDTDLSYSLHLNGYSNIFVPQAGARHEWGRGSIRGRLRRAWYHHQSVWRYFLKFQPNGFSLILLPAILLINFMLVAMLPGKRK